MAFDKKLSRYRAIISQVTNWPSYFLFKTGITGATSFTFQFKNGFSIEVPRNSLGPFRECFFDDQYLGNMDVSSLPSSPVILDIGANVGYASLHFFYRYPGAVIHSFEPMPYCINRIQTEQKLFPRFNWTLHKFGLWKEAGTLDIFTNSEDGFSTISGVAINANNQHRVTIAVNTLDNFFSNHPYTTIDLCKIDCEGAEYEIFFNTSDANLKKIKQIAMETHPTNSWKQDDMISFLQKKGFKVQVSGDYLWAKL